MKRTLNKAIEAFLKFYAYNILIAEAPEICFDFYGDEHDTIAFSVLKRC